MHPEQRRIFRSMSPERKLELAERLYREARELKFGGLKALHPDWEDSKIREKVREIFLHARTQPVSDFLGAIGKIDHPVHGHGGRGKHCSNEGH